MKTEFERLQARLPMDMLSMKRYVFLLNCNLIRFLVVTGHLKVSLTIWGDFIFSLEPSFKLDGRQSLNWTPKSFFKPKFRLTSVFSER